MGLGLLDANLFMKLPSYHGPKNKTLGALGPWAHEKTLGALGPWAQEKNYGSPGPWALLTFA